MKQVLIIAALLIGATATQAQNDAISSYFKNYLDDDRFTVVYVSGKLFSMFRSMDIDLNDDEAEAILQVVEDMEGLRLITTEITPDVFYKEAKRKIDTRAYETLMTVRSAGNGENVEILVKDEGEIINELLLLVNSDDTFVLMSFVGKINLDKIGELQRAFEDKER